MLKLRVARSRTDGEYVCMLFRRTSGETRERVEAERRDMSTALQTLSEPVIMMKDRVIITVNDATLETFGYDSKDELEGQPVTVLMPPDVALAHDTYVDRYETTGDARVVGSPQGVRRPSLSHAALRTLPCPSADR